jgi:hypothetical protein
MPVRRNLVGKIGRIDSGEGRAAGFPVTALAVECIECVAVDVFIVVVLSMLALFSLLSVDDGGER